VAESSYVKTVPLVLRSVIFTLYPQQLFAYKVKMFNIQSYLIILLRSNEKSYAVIQKYKIHWPSWGKRTLFPQFYFCIVIYITIA
jgi:hypothetical protein